MKPETVFGLENAAWPAFLVRPDGRIFLTNAAARGVFGAALTVEAPSLAAVWAPENGVSPEDYLARWEQSPVPMSVLKFRTAAGAVTPFNTSICQYRSGDKKIFVLQLLPAVAGAPSEPEEKSAAGDSAMKQKLDCMLQLARTVSLD